MIDTRGGEIWAIDSEWGFRDGRVDQESAFEPVVMCVVGQRSGRRHSFWGSDHRLQEFFRDHAGDLFVAHYVVAEMKYLLRLGAPLPMRWFDTFVAWRYLTNRPDIRDAGLAEALVSLGQPGLAPSVKYELRQKILDLRFDANAPADRRQITEYCFSDCDGAAALAQRVHDRISADTMMHWVEYLKAAARMELRGIPFDLETYRCIQIMRPTIRAALIGHINTTWPVFDGATLNRASFLRWCRSKGIAWPTRQSEATGRLYHCLDNEVMKEMEARHPFIAEVRQVGKTLRQFQQRILTVDCESHRHYSSTSVFRSVTGRNQPRSFVFSAPKWMRNLIVSESPDHVLAYVDYTAQEIGVAAALSRDATMQLIYEADPCHIAFAIRAGAAPPSATRTSHPHIRKQYKTVNLGMQYGQTAHGVSYGLGVPFRDAERLVDEHHALFPEFWRWSDRMVQGAYDRGWIKSPCGWRSKVPFGSNERTWRNWPIQAAGADIMRLTITYLDRQNVRVLAPVHDGFLLSCRRDQLADLRAAVDYACGTAVEHVLPGFPLRWEVTVYENGRFEDEDGRPLWDRLQKIMEAADAEKKAPSRPL